MMQQPTYVPIYYYSYPLEYFYADPALSTTTSTTSTTLTYTLVPITTVRRNSVCSIQAGIDYIGFDITASAAGVSNVASYQDCNDDFFHFIRESFFFI